VQGLAEAQQMYNGTDLRPQPPAPPAAPAPAADGAPGDAQD